ncbi:MAG: trypsin-like serine protease [Pseudomonadota bacterium]
MKSWFRKALFIAGISLVPLPAFAGSSDWIGRVNYAGYSMRSHCTGALIAPNLVLTAAHCLVSGRTEKPFKPKNVIFRAGYHLGKSKADAQGAHFIFLKGYLEAQSDAEKVKRDAAIIVLQDEINLDAGKISTIDATHGSLEFQGYSISKPHVLTGSEDCSRKSSHSKLFLVSCTAAFGQSGSPVLSGKNKEIVGMIVGVNDSNQAIILSLTELRHLETDLFNIGALQQ